MRCCCQLVAVLVALAAAAADPPYYHRQGDWAGSHLAAREALSQFEAEEAAGAARTADVVLGPWHSAGPFLAPKGQSAFPIACPPEAGVDLAATYNDGKLRWVERRGWADGAVHDLAAGDHSATYLFRTLTAKTAGPLTVYLGSDDGCELFLNGARLLSQDVPRGCAPNQVTLKLDLHDGENRLLYKIVNITGGYAFYFSTEANPGDIGSKRRAELWDLLARDFPADAAGMGWEREDGIWNDDWPDGGRDSLARRYAAATRGAAWQALAGKAAGHQAAADLYRQARAADDAARRLRAFDAEAVRLAIRDLRDTFGDRYPGAAEYLRRLAALQGTADAAVTLVVAADPAAVPGARQAVDELIALQREALLANPLLAFDRLLAVRRRGFVGLPQNWQGNSSIPGSGYDNQLCLLDPQRPDDPPVTLYQPPGGRYVGDLDLHWDASRVLFSMPDEQGRWQVHELRLDGTGLRQVTPGDQPDVSSFDACYLPDGRIAFCSTACFQGVPCVGGGDAVSLLYLLDPATGKVRQLTFDQDHSWDPCVLPSGRVLYGRWEYSDIPHYFSRLVMSMNPDGTAQSEYYGSNSYWPNSLFYCRPVPGSPTRFVGIVSGHHGERRAGELVLFDTAKGRREAAGVVQRIPGRGQPVPATIEDQLVAASWPKFLHPWPLSEKYYLVACKPSERADWGIYLADVFDNLVLLHEEPGAAFLEPVPVLSRPEPPVIVDKVQPQRRDAAVYMEDVYAGGGLDGVPRGTVKQLRVFEDHYTYNQMGGHIQIGVDGPWDVKRILGTVPVDPDGSAIFRVPANTPITVQPLDAEGRAVQLMRSWLTAMPGETVSCIGCHERRNDAPGNRLTSASHRPPNDITPWHGPTRGFSFRREVQPVLDRYCVACHDGSAAAPDLRDDGHAVGWGGFVPAYLALHPFVRRPGPESDYHLLTPLEFHAGTSELVQRLRKGHHGVQLDAEAWDRLYTWIDLNVPCHGTWHEQRDIPANYAARRRELRLLYANVAVDPEEIPDSKPVPVTPVKPVEPPLDRRPARADGWPFAPAEAQRRQAALGPHEVTVDAGGVNLALVRVPAGAFVMGDPQGEADELPAHAVEVAAPFWIGRCEVTNAQYARFDASHDSRYISETNKDQTRRGIPVNEPQQPVVRVSWSAARAYCRWLSERLGARVDLPTEAQWEDACRAGSEAPLWFGGADADFAPFANLADASLAGLARGDSPQWAPRDKRSNDGALVTCDVGRYQPNAWGLCDMAGNAAEWTRSVYRPYPAHDEAGHGERVVRGGSWYDRPQRCRSAFRLSYPEWQRVYNVGFRVVVEGDLPGPLPARANP